MNKKKMRRMMMMKSEGNLRFKNTEKEHFPPVVVLFYIMAVAGEKVKKREDESNE